MTNAITIVWGNAEKTILVITYPANWKTAELSILLDTAITMLDSVEHPVHVISDFRASNLVPAGLVTQFQRIYAYAIHENMGLNIIVGTNSFMQMFADLFVSRYPKAAKTIRLALTLPEAHQIIENEQATL